MEYEESIVSQFFALVRAGLWETDVQLLPLSDNGYAKLYQLAEEQSVVGLVTTGLERVVGTKVPQDVTLQFIGSTLQIEQRNISMNRFIAELITNMNESGLDAVLIKGQGVAQCYNRPLWRAAGDVDLFLCKENYEKAKVFLKPISVVVEEEDIRRLHIGMNIGEWAVELHGTMRTAISRRMDRVIDNVQRSIFADGKIRDWNNENMIVRLPSPDNDVILVFTHFLKHFYVGGIGLRQICDWCRLLWSFRDKLNVELLERRLKEARIMTEWKGFAAFAVDYLGIPVEAMPFYIDSPIWHRRADKMSQLILETGNFGHNKDESYRKEYSRVGGLMITLGRRVKEYWRLMSIFPSSAPRIFVTYVLGRVKANLYYMRNGRSG